VRGMEPLRPDFRSERLINEMRAGIRRCGLDLAGTVVFTEAASGAYVVTPVLAAMAGAQRVVALARATHYGSVDDVAAATIDLARLAAVSDRVEIVSEKRADVVAAADIITNSGHVRPIDAEMIGWMKPTAVVPLMFEGWEFRPSDLDLSACRQRGIAVAGTNERHPAVDVLPFVGMMAVRLLLDAGVAMHGSRLVVWCDNPFRPLLVEQLTRAGAVVDSIERLDEVSETTTADAILVALKPRVRAVVSSGEAETIARHCPGAIVVQFWGDFDRTALARAAVSFWPLESPLPGHQGILPSCLGPEPIVRLQCGGLKVGEVMAAVRMAGSGSDASPAAAVAAAVRSGFGQALGTDAPGGVED